MKLAARIINIVLGKIKELYPELKPKDEYPAEFNDIECEIADMLKEEHIDIKFDKEDVREFASKHNIELDPDFNILDINACVECRVIEYVIDKQDELLESCLRNNDHIYREWSVWTLSELDIIKIANKYGIEIDGDLDLDDVVERYKSIITNMTDDGNYWDEVLVECIKESERELESKMTKYLDMVKRSEQELSYKHKQYEGQIGFIPDACRECDSFVLHEPCSCEHDCYRVDSMR